MARVTLEKDVASDAFSIRQGSDLVHTIDDGYAEEDSFSISSYADLNAILASRDDVPRALLAEISRFMLSTAFVDDEGQPLIDVPDYLQTLEAAFIRARGGLGERGRVAVIAGGVQLGGDYDDDSPTVRGPRGSEGRRRSLRRD